MPLKLRTLNTLLLLIVFSSPSAYCQSTLSVEEQLAQLEMEMDSSSLFLLFDSLLQMQVTSQSEIHVRLSYNNNVLTAGRNYGVDQHGISSGVSFYHKSGIYSDLSGYWNSAFTPKYNLTIASLGYMRFVSKRWSTSVSYDRWIYNTDSDERTFSPSFKNSLNASAAFLSKNVYASIDYSYLFGSENAHRLIGSLSGSLSWKNVWFLDRLKIMPTFSLIFGNDIVTTSFTGDFRQAFRENEYLRQNLQSREFLRYANAVISSQERDWIQNIRNNESLSSREKLKRITSIYLANAEVAAYVSDSLAESTNEYGIMNYSFSLPILLSIKNFTWSINYTYSIPVNLPGETADLNPIGYLSTSLSYRIPIK